jgi:poly(3-hydroxybutyrate) depolymerase
MLYQMVEWQRAMAAPMTAAAGSFAKAFANPASPLALWPGAARMAAGLELAYRLGKHYEKPEFNITSVQAGGREIPVLERIEMQKPFCRLIRFDRYSDDAATIERMGRDPVVLLCAPLSGHHSTLLRDTVRTLLPDHRIYLTDWIDARMVPADQGSFCLNDYVNYIQEFIRHLGAGNLHVISVCQPTVPVLAAISLLASRKEATPATMTMMGGPIDARLSPTSVNSLATQRPHEWFEHSLIYSVPSNYPGAGRRVYPGFLQHSGFVAMNPSRHFKAHWDYFLDLVRGDKEDAAAHVAFYDEYNAVLDMDADFYLDTIRTVFQEFQLPLGTWQVDGELVRPQDIRGTALLTIEGELDDISGSGQTEAAHTLCTGIAAARRQHYVAAGAGHYGVFSGRRWREKVYPEVRAFIRNYAR